MTKIRIEKRTALLIAAAFVALVLLVPMVSPTQLLLNMVGSSKAQSDLIKGDTIQSDSVTPMALQMNHYNLIPQALLDNYIQSAYATGTFRHFTLIASEGVTTLTEGDKLLIFSFNDK